MFLSIYSLRIRILPLMDKAEDCSGAKMQVLLVHSYGLVAVFVHAIMIFIFIEIYPCLSVAHFVA